MRTLTILAVAAMTLVSSPVTAKPAFSLQPFDAPTFALQGLRPLPANHPLYRRVRLEPIADMPAKVGGFLAPITNAQEMSEALRATLEGANMLAPDPATAKAQLSVRWVELDAPQNLSFSSKATASLDYSLVRIDNRQEIFRRSITTYARSQGGDGTKRFKGNARLAILSNLASAILCLDKAAFGQAPPDCALKPMISFRAPAPRIMIPIRVPRR